MTLVEAFQLLLLLQVVAITGVVFMRLLNGGISTAGLLSPETGGGGIAPDRLQALLITLGGAVVYLGTGLQEVKAALNLTTMPEAPQFLVDFVLGSQILYLAGKVFRGK